MSKPWRFEIGNHWVAAVGLFFFLFGVVAAGARVVRQYHPPGPFSHETAGFCDFHNGLYFPTVAFWEGVSPYGEAYVAEYPVSRQLPFFSPIILVLHTPFTGPPLRVAEFAYFGWLVFLVLSIAYTTTHLIGRPGRLDLLFATAGALVMARGGHSTLYDGYFTFEMVLATILAVHWSARRPWLAALALVVVSTKPTYILPLGFLLLARGNYKSLVIGAVLSITAALVPLLWLASHTDAPSLTSGVIRIIDEIGRSQDFHLTVLDEMPLHTWTRVDLFAIIAKWLEINPSQTLHLVVMFPLLAGPMFVLYRRRHAAVDDGAAGLTGLIVLSALLVTVYHHSYDALVLISPLIAILVGGVHPWYQYDRRLRWMIAFLIMVPFYNYLSTQMFLSRIPVDPVVFKFLTSISGFSVAALMGLSCKLAWDQIDRSERIENEQESSKGAHLDEDPERPTIDISR